MNNDFKCCGEKPVRSNNEYFGRWMCPICNQLFDRTFKDGDDSNGEFVATGMHETREEQEQNNICAQTLSLMLGHTDLYKQEVN